MFRLVLTLLTVTAGSYAGAATSFIGSDYRRRFYGLATTYGLTTSGSCGMRGKLPAYEGMLPVAMNEAQYAGSKSCGACLEMVGTGKGIGTVPVKGRFKAYAHDRCAECKVGGLDLSTTGDGVWKINWRFVPCPKRIPQFFFEGSNPFYKKLQVRGLTFPAATMTIAGRRTVRSQDNFFVVWSARPFRRWATVRIVDIKGNTMKAWLRIDAADGALERLVKAARFKFRKRKN